MYHRMELEEPGRPRTSYTIKAILAFTLINTLITAAILTIIVYAGLYAKKETMQIGDQLSKDWQTINSFLQTARHDFSHIDDIAIDISHKVNEIYETFRAYNVTSLT